MEKMNNLLGALYKGDKEGANQAFDSIMQNKAREAVNVKKVAVASDIFNQRNVKG